jgi:tetratricopeptide (TPR) repeat protein
MMADEPTHVDFFISYTGKDSRWAEWIAMQLEEAGYDTIIKAWDFRPGSNFVAEMDEAEKRAERILLVLSAAYLASDYAFAEWAAAFRNDARGKQGRVLPVRIERCEVEGLLGPIVYIDLVDLDEPLARERLLAGVQRERAKPVTVAFPASPPVPLDRPVFPGSLPPVWNVPYPRNSFFIGRDEILSRLHEQLKAGQVTALSQPQAISGLGGIGKTQLALEYAYRYHQNYQAVLWAFADSREALISSYVAIATFLRLPEHEAKAHDMTVQAVKTWLQTHHSWLLILDNADELALLADFLPPAQGGHVLLTTRASATGRLAHRLEIETLLPEQGALFLLRRAGLIAPDAELLHAPLKEQELALQMNQELGGLPLALDQAGAYLEESGMNLAAYWQMYHQHRADLFKQRGGLVADHPEPVATTWSLSFHKVQKTNPAAAEILRLCAYLAPDTIAEEILTAGSSFLGPTLRSVTADTFLLNQAIEVLRAYSLVRRDPREKTLSIHRLVQAVLQDTQEQKDQRLWAEWAILAVNAAFPHPEYETWPQCERLLTQALGAKERIVQYHVTREEAIHLLYETASYLKDRARYAEAEPLFQQSLHIQEQQLGPEHPDVASTLIGLADLYRKQSKYTQAESLFQRALHIREQQLGPEHPKVASPLIGLAILYKEQGKYAQAESLYKRALHIREQQLGPEHPKVASPLNGLATLYKEQGKYAQAELFCQRALHIREQQLGPEHPKVASPLNNLAILYKEQGKYAQAEPLYQRVLHIREQQLGPEHPDVAPPLIGLADLYRMQGKYAQAEPLLQRALSIQEQQLGPEHPKTAITISDLARLREAQENSEEASVLYARALAALEQSLGAQHPKTRETRTRFIALLHALGQHEKVARLERDELKR